MSCVLILGASGQIGRFLIPLLLADEWCVIALSRIVQPESRVPGLLWVQGDLCTKISVSTDIDTLISLGPLDIFAEWIGRSSLPGVRRVLALSSMSAISKQTSPEQCERELAARLVASEQRLTTVCAERGYAWTIFRPTLIYGAGQDRSLTPIARFAQRYRVLPVPWGASGLRQPVHAEDLAHACLAVLNKPSTFYHVYPLGGGERVRFDTMLRRVGECGPRSVLMIPVPSRLLTWVLRLAYGPTYSSAMTRLRDDLVANNQEAERDFGFSPRSFFPQLDDFAR